MNRSGAGLPRGTAAALKTASPNQGASPVQSSFRASISGPVLEATQRGANPGTISVTPAMGLSSRSKSAAAQRFISATKVAGSFSPRSRSSAATMSLLLTPMKRAAISSSVTTWPTAASVSATARQARSSLSTSTPSQSKIRRSTPLFLGIDVDRHARLVFGRPDRQRRADMRDIGRRRQLGRQETLIAVPVGGDDLEEKIRLAGEHVRFAYLGPTMGQRLEGLEIGLGLARQPDLGEDGDAEAQILRIDVGMISADEARLFERAHPAQARGCRNASPPGQLDIGHSAIGLQVAQDPAVDLVQLDAAH